MIIIEITIDIICALFIICGIDINKVYTCAASYIYYYIICAVFIICGIDKNKVYIRAASYIYYYYIICAVFLICGIYINKVYTNRYKKLSRQRLIEKDLGFFLERERVLNKLGLNKLTGYPNTNHF